MAGSLNISPSQLDLLSSLLQGGGGGGGSNVLEIPSQVGGALDSSGSFSDPLSLGGSLPDLSSLFSGGSDLTSLASQGGDTSGTLGGLDALGGSSGGLGAGLGALGIADQLFNIGQDFSGGQYGAGAGGLAGGGLGMFFGGPMGAAIGSELGSLLGGEIQSLFGSGLPANTKPLGAASTLESKGGVDKIFGDLIKNAQNAAGGGSGVLSQSGPNSFNEAALGYLLQELTGSNIFGGKGVASIPAGTGKPVQLAVKPLGAGNTGLGFTPAELSSPKAESIIEKLTKGGKLGPGVNITSPQGVQMVDNIVKALEKAGINPMNDQPGSKANQIFKIPPSTGNTLTNPTGGGGNTLNIPVQNLINTLLLQKVLNPNTGGVNQVGQSGGQQTNQLSNPASLLALLGNAPGGGFHFGWS